MPQLLALEWDQFEARIVVARQRGEDVCVDHAFSVSLAPRDPGQTFADIDVGQRLESALAARRIAKAETLVAVGRSSIELRLLSLPPAPEEEWPELVRFQAMPRFSNLGDDWPLDYFPLQTSSGEGTTVLAATISPELVRQINATAEAAGLTAARLVLRPCAAASLLIARGGTPSHRIRLFVDLLADEADLTVLAESQVLLMRTVRLQPVDGDDEHSLEARTEALGGEIRRTIASAQNQLGGERVGQIVLGGDRDAHREMAKQLATRLDLPVEHFDPFASLRLSSELMSKPPRHPERFAPLLGMIVNEASSRPHAIDFLHPKQKKAPKSRKRLLAIIGGLAAAVVLTVFALGWLELNSLRNRNAVLQRESEQLDNEVERAEQIVEKARKLEAWEQSNPHWLNELKELSGADRFPAAEDARLIELKISPRSRGGGQMFLVGFARDSDVMQEMEGLLRDEEHTVITGPSRENGKDPRYPWRFQETVRVETRPEDADRSDSRSRSRSNSRSRSDSDSRSQGGRR